MTPILGELVGTALLLLLGDGVVANVLLRNTKGENSGWIVVTFGWAMAVFVGVFAVAKFSGAHLNPAVTIGLVVAGKFDAALAPGYILAQFAGAILGSALVLLHYRQHFAVTEDMSSKLGVFSTGPAIHGTVDNLISEIIGTFVLVFGVLYLATPDVGLGALDALPVGLLVFAIGLALGGTTGYAINPARDLGPRLVHTFLPIPGGKGPSDWYYSWIPVVGPVIGAILAALAHLALGRTTLQLPIV
jgi:glycerol uptake facilitator protein